MITHFPWLLFLLLPHVICQTTDKYTDEDRPYKFGFNIQGYQHRQEEKDEKGLIKGEYGFITADGYYRVTVYATDENGDFRILSMKNYYVGFPPEDPTTTPEIPTQRPANTKPSKALPGRTDTQDTRPPVRPTGVPGCSDCWIPTTTNQPDTFGKDFSGSGGLGTGSGGFGPKSNAPGSQDFLRPTTNQNPSQQRNPIRENQALVLQKFTSKTGSKGSYKDFLSPGQSPFGNQPQGSPHALKTYSDDERPRIGEERDGLPPGVTVNDVKELLYRFNYTVGFHGHHEDGYRNGDKEGDYFFDGKDGTERQVKYLANEFGFQPNITFIELAENDERRPKEDTEKQYGLRGYEFKWFYRR